MKKLHVSTLTLLSVLGLAAGGAWAQGAGQQGGVDQQDPVGQQDAIGQEEEFGQDDEFTLEEDTADDDEFALEEETADEDEFALEEETDQQDQSQQVAQQDQQAQQEQTPQVQAYILIEEYDENSDVTLNREEFTKLYQDKTMSASSGQSSTGAAREPGADVAGGGQAPASQDQNAEQFQQRFEELDADDNGQVNSTELAEAIPVEEDARNIAGRAESGQEQDREV